MLNLHLRLTNNMIERGNLKGELLATDACNVTSRLYNIVHCVNISIGVILTVYK